jgi:hypothetical protein
MRSMSWVFTGLMKRARDPGPTLARRLNKAYARWHEKHRELPHGWDREQERRLLGPRSFLPKINTHRVLTSLQPDAAKQVGQKDVGIL